MIFLDPFYRFVPTFWVGSICSIEGKCMSPSLFPTWRPKQLVSSNPKKNKATIPSLGLVQALGLWMLHDVAMFDLRTCKKQRPQYTPDRVFAWKPFHALYRWTVWWIWLSCSNHPNNTGEWSQSSSNLCCFSAITRPACLHRQIEGTAKIRTPPEFRIGRH